MSIDEQLEPVPPPDAEVLWQQANGLVGQGDLSSAAPLYRQLSEIWPDQAPVWCNLGLVLRALQRFEEARPCLLRSLDLEPDNALAHYELGQLAEQLNKPDDATENYLMAPDHHGEPRRRPQPHHNFIG